MDLVKLQTFDLSGTFHMGWLFPDKELAAAGGMGMLVAGEALNYD